MEIKTLSEKLSAYRTDRPDEWTMDEFKRDAIKIEKDLDEALEKLAAMESQEPVYFWKEIGETDWMECHKDWYLKCVDSPEHDTKLLYAKPVPAGKSKYKAVTKSDLPLDPSREHLLNEAAKRADYFFRQVDGSYSFPAPDGQVAQIIEMLLAAANKPADKPAVAVPDGFREIVEAVAHIGVDFGYGNFALSQEHIEKARALLETDPSHSQQSAEVEAQGDDMGGEALSATKIHWDEFESWWEDHGQYIRAGGGQYEKTFAWKAWNWAIYQNNRKWDRCQSHESEQGGAV